MAEQEQEQATHAYDEDDSMPEATETAEVLQLRNQLQQLTVELSELKNTVCQL